MLFSVRLCVFKDNRWQDAPGHRIAGMTVRDALASLCGQPLVALINMGMESFFIAGHHDAYAQCRSATSKAMLAQDALVRIEELDAPILYQDCTLPLSIELKKLVKGMWYSFPYMEFDGRTVHEALVSLDNQPLVMVIKMAEETILVAGRKECFDSCPEKARKSLLVREVLDILVELDAPLLYQKLYFAPTPIFAPPPEPSGPLKLNVPDHVRERLAVTAVDTDQDDERLATWLYDQGIRHLQTGKPEEAVAVLRQAAGINQRNIRYSLALGNALEEAGDQAAALKEYDRAAGIDSRNWEPVFRKGKLLLEIGRGGEAIIALERALELSDQPNVRERLANAYCACGNQEKAAAILGRQSSKRNRMRRAA